MREDAYMLDLGKIQADAHRLRTLFHGAGPDDMCEYYDIWCEEMDLGTDDNCIKGFIHRNSRCYAIIINSNLPDHIKKTVKLHEVMHYCLGHLTGTVCTFEDRYFSYANIASMHLENEANFVLADHILDTCDTIEALHSMPLESAASIFCVPPEILKFKCRLLAYAGKLNNINNVSLDTESDFMKHIECQTNGSEIVN